MDLSEDRLLNAGDFRLPPLCILGFGSSGMLCDVGWRLI
jgi:hypothetical protein